jgi:hypothetical protein
VIGSAWQGSPLALAFPAAACMPLSPASHEARSKAYIRFGAVQVAASGDDGLEPAATDEALDGSGYESDREDEEGGPSGVPRISANPGSQAAVLAVAAAPDGCVHLVFHSQPLSECNTSPPLLRTPVMARETEGRRPVNSSQVRVGSAA